MTKRTRANGEGSIFRDKASGRWIGLPDLGSHTGHDGTRRRRRRKVTAKTKTEVGEKLKELRLQMEYGVDVAGGRAPTVEQLAQEWLALGAPGPRGAKQDSTLARLTRRIEDHLVRAVGQHRIDQPRVEHVDAWLEAVAARGISRRTPLDYRGDLRQLINQEAIRRRLVQINVAQLARISSEAAESIERRALTRDQRRQLYEALDGDRLGPYFVMIADMGLRPGETDAMRWEDVDPATESVRVRRSMKRNDKGRALRLGETKTRRSSRSLRLTGRAASSLRERRATQAAERLAAGSAWCDDERWSGLVFTSEVGTPLAPANVRRSLAAACRRAGIEAVSPYELRHTAATILTEDLPIERVADQLGHVDTRMVERHYRHAPRVIDAAAEVEQRRALG